MRIYTWLVFCCIIQKIKTSETCKCKILRNYRLGIPVSLLRSHWVHFSIPTECSAHAHYIIRPLLRFPLRSHSAHSHMLCVQQRWFIDYLFIVYKAYIFRCQVVVSGDVIDISRYFLLSAVLLEIYWINCEYVHDAS